MGMKKAGLKGLGGKKQEKWRKKSEWGGKEKNKKRGKKIGKRGKKRGGKRRRIKREKK